jgi:hypothetical protein
MSGSLERVVRPFQTGDVFTARAVMPAIPATGLAQSPDACYIEWTGENPGDYDDIPSDLILNNFTAEWEEDKSRRETEIVRIEQEGKPENYVEVERVQVAVMTNNQTGEEFRMRFADWARGRS